MYDSGLLDGLPVEIVARDGSSATAPLNTFSESDNSVGKLNLETWLRRLVATLSPRRPGFDPGSVHAGFVVGKVALGQAKQHISVTIFII